MAQAWLIASGKGGVGKSTIAAGLGQALAQMGQRVCVADADIGLRDQDVILGLENRVVYDMVDVCRGKCRIDQALIPVEGYEGLMLLPAAQFARARDLDPKAFRKLMRMLKLDFDFILIDCPAGIEKGLRSLLRSECEEAAIVVTSDDVCIRNAERTGVLIREKGKLHPQIIVNKLVPELIRSGEMYPALVVGQTLEMPVLGEIVDDPAVLRTLLNHMTLLSCQSEAGEALRRIARRMTGEDVPLPDYGHERPGFFKRLLARLSGG